MANCGQKTFLLTGAAILALAVSINDASAQNTYEEIVVTARKRDETSLATPVVLTAVGSKEIERRQITGIDHLAHVAPTLVVGEGGGSVQGGIIAIRGIGSGESNPFVDQAVTFNIDGVPVAQAAVRRLAEMDLRQVEILKGPQALFFGKNSPGGIISMRTADPTPNLQARIAVGYEFEAEEKQLQGFISGPLTDKLGGRLSFYADHMNGWVDNKVPRGELLAPYDTKLPRAKEYAIRGALKFDSGDRFDARMSFAANSRRGTGPGANTQVFYCPFGAPQGVGSTGPLINDCTQNDVQYHGDPGPTFASNALGRAAFGNGIPFMNQQQMLGSLEMNYDLTKSLRLTSVTGYYNADIDQVENFVSNYAPSQALPSHNFYEYNQYSQEVRLASDFDKPLNFLAGGLYTHSWTRTGSITERNALAPGFVNQYELVQKDDAWSLFGQLRWNVLKTVELSGGARYSHERKTLPKVLAGTSLTSGLLPANPVAKEGSWNNLSPEATISWRPTDRFTVFGSYKYGFLSGGFNSGATNFNTDLRYSQQIIRGFEGGIKGLFLNDRLRTNLAYYNYVTTGLAITTSVNAILLVQSAGKVKMNGVEFDFNYLVPKLDGLTVRGAMAYNHARYAIYSVTCWPGQRPSQGCNQSPTAAGVFTLQNLAGTPLLRTPEWSGSAGLGYETPIFSGLKLAVYVDGTFSGGYFADAQSIPNGYQKSFALLDTTATISDEKDRWEFAVIGRNLTNQFTRVRANSGTFQGSGTGTAAGLPGDLVAPISRGREIWLRVTLNYGQ